MSIPCFAPIFDAMKENELNERGRGPIKTLKRAVRKPRKIAPEPESVRGWAKSSLKSRAKS